MRTSDFFGLGACAFSLFFAYYFLELYLNLDPCPLCILDRFVVGVMGLLFAVGLFVDRLGGRLALLGGNAVLAGLGFVLTGRHVWLQNQPLGEGSVCLAEQEQIEGLVELVREAFDAQADCGMIVWELFGLSIPMMTLLLFVGLSILLLLQGFGILQDRQARAEEADDADAARL